MNNAIKLKYSSALSIDAAAKLLKPCLTRYY